VPPGALTLLAVLTLAVGGCVSGRQASGATAAPSGASWVPSTIDSSPADVDSATAPCHDFYQYATGGWYLRTPRQGRTDDIIGPDPNLVGTALRQLVATAPALARTTQDPTLRVLGYFYGSCLTDTSGAANAGTAGDTTRASYCFRTTRQYLGPALEQVLLERLWSPAGLAQSRLLAQNVKLAAAERFRASRALSDKTKQELLARVDSIRITAEEYARLKGSIPFPDNILTPRTYPDYRSLRLSPTDFAGNLARVRSAPATVSSATVSSAAVSSAAVSEQPSTVLDVLLGHTNSHAGGLLKVSYTAPLGQLIPPVVDGMVDIGGWYGTQSPLTHHISHSWDRILNALGEQERAAFAEEQFRGQLEFPGKRFGHPFNDHIGVLIAYDAFQRAAQGRSGPMIDGFTPDQRFFLGIALGWRGGPVTANSTDNGRTRWRVLTNGALSVMPAFARAFGCKAGDPMAGGKIWYQDPWGNVALTSEERQELYHSYIDHTFGSFDGLRFGGGARGQSTLTAEQTATLTQLATAQVVQQRALMDSLRADVGVAPGVRRVLQLLARQIGERRAVLTPAQQASIDPEIQRWIQWYGGKGGRITVPGVQP
jgi:hypothetical protein